MTLSKAFADPGSSSTSKQVSAALSAMGGPNARSCTAAAAWSGCGSSSTSATTMADSSATRDDERRVSERRTLPHDILVPSSRRARGDGRMALVLFFLGAGLKRIFPGH
jgi:hypothetical protein